MGVFKIYYYVDKGIKSDVIYYYFFFVFVMKLCIYIKCIIYDFGMYLLI